MPFCLLTPSLGIQSSHHFDSGDRVEVGLGRQRPWALQKCTISLFTFWLLKEALGYQYLGSGEIEQELDCKPYEGRNCVLFTIISAAPSTCPNIVGT